MTHDDKSVQRVMPHPEDKAALTGGPGRGVGLRQKLIMAFAAMAVVPLVLVNIMTSRTTERAMMRSVFEKNLNLAETISGEINQTFVDRIRMMKVVAGSADIISMVPLRQTPVLRDLTTQYPDLLIALVTTPGGDLLVRSDGKWSKINYSDRDHFKTAMRTGSTVVSDALVSRTTGKLGIAIDEPIRGPDRTLRGMLIVTVDLQQLIDRIAETKIGKTGYAFVVNREGKVLIHPDRSLVETAMDLSGLAPVRAAIGGKRGWEEYEFRGQKKLAGYSHVPVTGWGLVAQQPLAEALADVTTVRNTNIVIMLCTVVFAFLIDFALAGVLFKPIAMLTSAARKVAGGDLTVQAGFVSTNEIGTLSATFNEMTTQLRIREEALRQSEEKYRTIVDTAIEGIWVKDENHRTTFVNPRMAEMLGYQPEEMTGHDTRSFMFEEDWQDSEKRREARRQGVTQQYERRWRRKDGRTLWTIVSAKPVFLDAEHRFKGSFAMLTDISERKQAEEERERAFERLRIALDATVHAIATMVEARDPYTAGHQRRVSNLACAIANEMGLPPDRVEGVRVASMIHDIGKIAVPSEMLCKPTKLSEKEFDLIKDHVQAGYDILKQINFPWPIARMVIEHHERMDGSGYPNGLTGEKLLLESRIITVADSVEAVASHRPYRPAYGIDKALDEIQKNRGMFFDPDVVDACTRLFRVRGFVLENPAVAST